MIQAQYTATYHRGYSKTLGFMQSRGMSLGVSEDLAQGANPKSHVRRVRLLLNQISGPAHYGFEEWRLASFHSDGRIKVHCR